MLDAVGYHDEIMQNDLERLLEFSDWMGILQESYAVTSDCLLAFCQMRSRLITRLGANQSVQAVLSNGRYK